MSSGEVFSVKNTEYFLKAPTLEDHNEAQKVYNKTYSDALTNGAILRAKLEDVMEAQGLWNEDKKTKLLNLQSDLNNKELTLAKGGISKLQGKKLALEMKEIRDDIRKLMIVRAQLDSNTAEGQAENNRFNYLVSSCLVYNNDRNKKYFQSFADYLNNGGDEVGLTAAQKLAYMLGGLDSKFEEKLPENRFLKRFNFVDDKFRLVNKDGKLVDAEGRLVNENGHYVDAEGNLVDKDGQRVDDSGNYIVDEAPFFDDEEEVQPEAKTETVEVKPETAEVKE